MNILLADTSSSICITGMANEEKIICENSLNNGRTHSENFMPLIEQTILKSGISLDEIDNIAVVVGPRFFYRNKNRNS